MSRSIFVFISPTRERLRLALACLLPQIFFEVFFARPFDITAYDDSVDYEFTSKDYAVDFATLNIDAEWVKVNGEVINP